MILRGARVALSATRFERLDIEIRGATIHKLGAVPGRAGIDLAGHAILPGLINAHDHLEFNLFPRLGRGPWPNASAWARDIYRPDESPVREHRRVPRRVRLYWGALKNLVSGVTTVCHHNPYERKVFGARFPVRVVRDIGWAHSLAFSPDFRQRYRATPVAQPFVIHAAEAVDGSGKDELRALDRMGVVTERTMLVHAVGADWKLLRDRGASVVTCPSSNLFSLGRTLAPAVFRSRVPIALGTDSAITASADLLDELRLARRIWKLSAPRLYRMVTEVPAAMLRLTDGRGAIREAGAADLIVLGDPGRSPAETLLAARGVEMVVVAGRVRLGSMTPHRLEVRGRGSIRVDADTRALYRAAVKYVGEPLRLAGKEVRL